MKTGLEHLRYGPVWSGVLLRGELVKLSGQVPWIDIQGTGETHSCATRCANVLLATRAASGRDKETGVS